MNSKWFKFAALSGFAHTKLSHTGSKRDGYVITFGALSSHTNMHTFNPVTSFVLQNLTAPELVKLVISGDM